MASGNQTAVDHSTWLSLNDLVVGNTGENGALIPPEEAFPRSIRHHVRRRSPTLDELIAEAIPYSPNSSAGGGGPSTTLVPSNQKELGVGTNSETKQELLEAARAVEERLNFSSNAKKKNISSLSKMSVYQPHRRTGARAQNTRHPSGQSKKRPPLTTDVVKKIRNKILAGGSTARGFCNLVQVFKAADMDRDGYLSMMEWEHLVCKRGVQIPPDIANRLFKKLDTKQSGLMDFDQFSTFMEMDSVLPGAVATNGTAKTANPGGKKGGRISPPTIVSSKTPEEVALEREISRLNSKLSKKTTHAKSRKKPPPFSTGSSRAGAGLANTVDIARVAKKSDAGRARTLTTDYTASAQSKKVTTAASPTTRARAPTAPTRVDGPALRGTNAYSLDHNIENLLQRARENPSPNVDNIINDSISKGSKEEEEVEVDMAPPVLNERQSQLLNLTRARGDTLPLGPSAAPAPQQLPPAPPPPPTAPVGANGEVDGVSSAPREVSREMTEADFLELQLLRRQNVEKDSLLNEYQEEKKKLTDRLHVARMDHLDAKTTSQIGVVGYIPSQEAMVGYRTRNGNVVDSVQTSRDLELALAETSMKMERMADELRRLKLFEHNASVQIQYATARNREAVQEEMDALRQENERLKADLGRRDKELQQSRADLARATAKLRHHARRASMPTNYAGASSFADRRRASVTAPKSTPDATSIRTGTVDAAPRPGSYVEKFKNKQNRALNARHGRADSAPPKVAENPKYRNVTQALETILDKDHGNDSDDGDGGDDAKIQGERGAPDALEAAVAKRKKSIEALKQSTASPNDPDSSSGEEDDDDDFGHLPPPDSSAVDNRNDAFFKDMKKAKELKVEQEQRELDEKINNMTEQERQAFEAGERETKKQEKKRERHLQILAKANNGKVKKKQIGGGRGKNTRIPKVQTPSNLLHLPASPPTSVQSNPPNNEANLPSPPPAYDSSDEDEDEGASLQGPAVPESQDDERSRNAQFSVVPKPPLPPPLPDDIHISTPETSFRDIRSNSQESDIPPPPRMPAPTMDTLDNFDANTDDDDADFVPPPGAPPPIILPPSLPPPDLTNSPAVDRYEL